MLLKKLNYLGLAILAIAGATSAKAQLYINNAQLTIQSGASVVVQGDVTSNADILGAGKVVLNGTANQNVDMGGYTIPNLEMNNTANATLVSDVKIGSSLLFTNGKIITGNNNVTLADVATVSGMGTSKFIETSGTGQVFKSLTANVTSNEIPVGVGTSYRPAFITTSATYSSAKVGVRVVAATDPNKPPKISDYLGTYWPLTKTGITGTVTVAGQYVDPSDVSGTETNIRGYYYNGTDWSSASEAHDATLNRVSAPLTAASGDLYGMDKFVAVGSRAFLQGAYSTATGLMSESLRTLGYIPTSDPYRTATYSTAFVHVSNSTTETTTPTVLGPQASSNDNIVDWVFLELRNNNASPGNTVLQTRSALIQRDGDIVDIDGVSPVTFNNIADGSYTLAVRHRNHLGLATNPTSPKTVGEGKSTAFTTNVIDLRSTNTQLYGTTAGYTTATHPTLTTVNLLWGGNANSNTQTKYQGAGNDPAVVLSDLSNNQLSILSGYYRSDVNMNGQVKYQGAGNDPAFILNVLGSSQLAIRTQQLPN
jgi:hypothetical protein